MRRAWAALFIGLGCALVPARASADPPRREPVVLVFPRGDPFGLRLAAELRSIGIDVVTVASRGRAPKRAAAVAVVSAGEPRRVELRVGGAASPRGAADFVFEAETRRDEVGSLELAEQVRTALVSVAWGAERVAAASTKPTTDTSEPASGAARTAAPSTTTLDPPRAARPEAAGAPSTPADEGARTTAMSAPTVDPATLLANTGAPRGSAVARAEPPTQSRRDPLDARLGTAQDGRTARDAPPLDAPRVTLGAGLAAALAPYGAGLDATISGAFQPLAWLRVGAFVEIPIVPTAVSETAGDADVYAGLVGARAELAYDAHPRVAPFVGLGLGGVWLRAVGRPSPGFVGSTEDAFSGAATLDTGLRVRLGERFALAPRATIGVGLPPVTILFDGAEVASWGLPFGSIALVAEGDVFVAPSTR